MSSPSPFRPIPQRPIIRGRRVWLRPVDEGDLEQYCAAVNEQEPGWWAGYPGGSGMRQVRTWFDSVVQRHGGDGYWFTICPLGGVEFLGQIWLWDINHRVPGAELSIYVTTPGQGIGADAIDAAVDFGFDSLRLPRIWGFTDEQNTRSLASFERCGFVVEGRIRGVGRSRSSTATKGEPGDMVQFSMTRADWTALARPRSWELNI